MTYKSSHTEELGLVALPDVIAGTDYISDLRLWAVTQLPFNSAVPNYLFGGPSPSNQPSGTYTNGRYDDEYYPATLGVDTDDFAESEAAFDDAFTHWSNMTSYPSLRGEAYPKGPAFKTISNNVTAATQQMTFRVAPANIQWLWLWFYHPASEDNPDFNVRLTLYVEDQNGVVAANQTEFSNPTFGRLTIRSRQINPKYSLRLTIERIDPEGSFGRGIVPLRLAGRLGRFKEFGFSSNL